ncbi:MAG: hypothetical protein V4604_07050 [Bacteroidota bacterium]
MNNISVYDTEQLITQNSIRYFFESNGEKSIIKAIDYSPIDFKNGKTIYNLGFGDYDEQNDTINDDINSNNGDHYIVLNTVLFSVPLFFAVYPNAVLFIGGSDSSSLFLANCKISCNKKCDNSCKNHHRRIKVYRYFIDKNFESLSQSYVIFGRNKLKNNSFLPYIRYESYDDLLIYLKKSLP